MVGIFLLMAFQDAKAICERCHDRGEIVCTECKGEFRLKEQVLCKRSRAIGCDGKGFRECFQCNGDGSLQCGSCKGSGTTTVSTPYTDKHGHIRYHDEPKKCVVCIGPAGNSTGRVDCPKCHELYLVQHDVGVDIQGQARPGDVDERLEGLRAARRGWFYEESRIGGRKFVGMIRCPRCMGRGMIEENVLCDLCKAGKMPCPDCKDKNKKQDISVGPLDLTRAMQLKAACIKLNTENKEQIQTIIDEYMRLRNVLTGFSKNQDWEALLASIEESDKNMQSVIK